MTYSGSTQNSSYSKRTYNKRLSTDLADYAKALDKQRKEQVKGFQQASKDQLGELDRQDGIAASNDKFQIAQLSKFSDTLNDFLDTTVKTVGKAYIDSKREEGVELYRRYLAGNEDAIAEVEANAEQLKEIEAKINEMSAEIGESTDAFLDRKSQEELSLKDKIKALNVRKLNPNVRWGFVRAQLQEAGAGYNGHLIDTLHSSTEEFTTRDGNTYVIGNYHNVLSEEHKEEIIRHVEDQYIANNNPFGAADSVRNSFLTAKVVETTEKFKEKEFLKNKAEQGEVEQTGRIDKIITSAINFDADATKTVTLDNGKTKEVNISRDAVINNIKDIIDNGSSSESLVNGNVSPHKANKTRIINGIEEALSFLDEESAADLVDLLKEAEFTMVGITGTLETLFAGDLNLDELLVSHQTKLAQNFAKRKQVAKVQLEKEENLYNIQWLNGEITLREYNDKALVIRENPDYNILRNSDDDNYFQNKINAIKNWKPNEHNYKESMSEIDRIMGEVGFLTNADLFTLNVDARKHFFENAGEGKKYKYKENPIWEDIGIEKWGENVKFYTDKLNQSVDKILKNETTQLVDASIEDAAQLGVKKELLRRANLYYLNGASANDALFKANQEVSQELLAGTGIFVRDGEKFLDSAMNPAVIADTDTIEAQITEGAKVTNKLDILQSNGLSEDHLKNTILVPEDSNIINLEKGEDGIIRFIPNTALEIVEYSETGYTAIDFINMQRKLHKLDEYKLEDFSPELQLLHTGVKEQFPHLAKVFTSGAEGQSLAIDEIGAIDLNTLLNASVINMEQPIAEVDLDSALERFNINKDDYLNDATLQEEVRRKQINYLLKEALKTTNDKNQAILMVATGMRFGEAEMSNFGEGSIFDNKKNDKSDYAYAVLDAYYSGDTSALIGTYNDSKVNVNNIRELTKDEKRLGITPNYVIESIVNRENMWDIDYRDPAKIKAILEILTDPQFTPDETITVPGMFGIGKSNINNPLLKDYNKALNIYKNIDRVITALNNNDADVFIESRSENFNLVNLLLFQQETDLGGRPLNNLPVTDSVYYDFKNKWMEDNGHKFKGANKEEARKLRKERMLFILEKSREFLGYTEDN
tara:strand:+ start:4683 stop:7991 length:3309 start_codon:yes stop_codon:yes gene_type:complete